MSKFLLQQKKKIAKLSCLAVSLGKQSLLVPISSVAEVIHYKKPDAHEGPEWIVGTIGWRKMTIPVVDFSVMLGGNTLKDSQGVRLMVFNCLQSHGQFEYYAALTKNFPTTISVDEEDEFVVYDSPQSGLVDHEVGLKNERYFLPRMEWIEEQLENSYIP